MNSSRSRGSILIIVAGISALLASLSLAFLMRMRRDGEESDAMMREIQARMMLMAACSYIQEASRLGYGGKLPTADHSEAFGWVDVRYAQDPTLLDGNGIPLCRGPRDNASKLLINDATKFPAVKGKAARFPMGVMERPPFALRQTVAPNAIVNIPGQTDFGMPYLRNRDPLPVDSSSAGFITGDTRLRPMQSPAWFRIYRDSDATFVLTCGAGGTKGFMNWSEVLANNAQAIFSGDSSTFDALLAGESRLWYRVAWSPRIGDMSLNTIIDRDYSEQGTGPGFASWLDPSQGQGYGQHYVSDGYASFGCNASLAPMNYRDHDGSVVYKMYSRSSARNLVGTIQWIQRLSNPPDSW